MALRAETASHTSRQLPAGITVTPLNIWLYKGKSLLSFLPSMKITFWRAPYMASIIFAGIGSLFSISSAFHLLFPKNLYTIRRLDPISSLGKVKSCVAITHFKSGLIDLKYCRRGDEI